MKRQKKKSRSKLQRRITLIGVFFGMLFLVITGRAVHLHVYKGDWLFEKAEVQYKKTIKATGKRGTIFDAKHRELAMSIDATSIAAFPVRITDSKAAAGTLSRILHISRQTLDKRLASKASFVWIKRHATPREVEQVQKAGLAGVVFQPEHSRIYPNRALGAQVIGFTNVDGKGLEGLEYYYDASLKGSSMRRTVIQDARGKGFGGDQKTTTRYDGNNLVLTIDKAIQYIAETELDKAVQTYSGKSGIAIVMDPATGAILALAHSPQFNPNTYGQFNPSRFRNRAVTDPFEPGSTMKIFLAAGALESSLFTPNTIIYCENGLYRMGRRTIHDTKPHAWLSLKQVVKVSSNIGIAKVAEKIGRANLYSTLQGFGFGMKTGIDCPGETTGILTPPKRWSRIDFCAIAFGQGMSVSAIQLATAVSAVANDGVLMQPYIVKAITDPNGRIVHNFRPRKVRSVISPATARTVKRIMHTVTTKGGTGEKAAMDGYSVCGKTGTAQKASRNGGYAAHDYVASFVGFAPAENPRVMVLVIVDEPQEEHYGGIVAAPAFRQIAYETLNYLNVPPHYDRALDRPEHLQVARKGNVSG